MINYFMLGLLLLLNFNTLAFTKSNDKNSLLNEISTIIRKHNNTLKILFQQSPNFWDDEFDRSFFINNSFLNDYSLKSFFNKVNFNILSNQNLDNLNSYSYYSRSIMINGVFKSVHYEYKVNGGKAILNRYTNNNGHVLKVKYRYNVKDKLFEVLELKDSKIKNRNSYKLKV